MSALNEETGLLGRGKTSKTSNFRTNLAVAALAATSFMIGVAITLDRDARLMKFDRGGVKKKLSCLDGRLVVRERQSRPQVGDPGSAGRRPCMHMGDKGAERFSS